MRLDLAKIKELRIKNKISLKEMASLLGYETPTGYYYAESGRCKFKPNHIPLIAQKFQIPMEGLFLEEGLAKLAKDPKEISTA